MSAVAETGRGAPIPRLLPVAEVAARAVPVPMSKITHGEMMREVVVMRKMMKAVLKAAPIKTMKVAAQKSVSERRTEAAVCTAAAVGQGASLGENAGKDTNGRNDAGLLQRYRCHGQASHCQARHYRLSRGRIRPSWRSNGRDS